MPKPDQLTESDLMLCDFLDWFRGIAEHKLLGFTTEEATAVASPSGITPLGTLKHLAWDEAGWFGHFFLGRPDDEISVDDSFAIGPHDSVDSITEAYRRDCEQSRQIVAAAPSLDTEAAIAHEVFGPVDLRWIIVHMLEETARHAGHLDILTELTDGRVGD